MAAKKTQAAKNAAAEERIKASFSKFEREAAQKHAADIAHWQRVAAEHRASAERAARGEREPLPGGTWVQDKNGEWVASF